MSYFRKQNSYELLYIPQHDQIPLIEGRRDKLCLISSTSCAHHNSQGTHLALTYSIQRTNYNLYDQARNQAIVRQLNLDSSKFKKVQIKQFGSLKQTCSKILQFVWDSAALAYSPKHYRHVSHWLASDVILHPHCLAHNDQRVHSLYGQPLLPVRQVHR